MTINKKPPRDRFTSLATGGMPATMKESEQPLDRIHERIRESHRRKKVKITMPKTPWDDNGSKDND